MLPCVEQLCISGPAKIAREKSARSANAKRREFLESVLKLAHKRLDKRPWDIPTRRLRSSGAARGNGQVRIAKVDAFFGDECGGRPGIAVRRGDYP
jgi:hypothetical protein